MEHKKRRVSKNVIPQSADDLIIKATLKRDPFYEHFQYLFRIMRASGRLPYMRTETGEFNCSLFSTTTLYSVCMLSALTYVTYLLTFRKNLGELFKASYSEMIKYFLVLVFISPQMNSLVATPWQTHKIVAYMNHWRRFNVHFQKVIGSPLPYSLTRVPVSIVIALMLMITSSIVESHFLLHDLPWYLIWLYNVICYCNMVIVIYWFNVSLFITHSGQTLIDSLVKVLEVNPSTKRISEFRHLWLELCDLSLELPNSMYFAVIHIFTAAFIAFVFSSYGCFTGILEHNFSNVIEFVLPLLISLIVFVGFCNGAYIVRQRLGFDVLEAVLFRKLVELKEDARQEVELLLDTIESNPPVISLNGLFDINRHTLLQVASMSTTYLVVLLQFKISADSPGGLNIEQVNLTSVFGKDKHD